MRKVLAGGLLLIVAAMEVTCLPEAVTVTEDRWPLVKRILISGSSEAGWALLGTVAAPLRASIDGFEDTVERLSLGSISIEVASAGTSFVPPELDANGRAREPLNDHALAQVTGTGARYTQTYADGLRYMDTGSSKLGACRRSRCK